MVPALVGARLEGERMMQHRLVPQPLRHGETFARRTALARVFIQPNSIPCRVRHYIRKQQRQRLLDVALQLFRTMRLHCKTFQGRKRLGEADWRQLRLRGAGAAEMPKGLVEQVLGSSDIPTRFSVSAELTALHIGL